MDHTDPNATTGGSTRDPAGDAGGHPARGRARLGLRYSALSDVGRVRKDNQDSGFASDRLLVIADGVGGAARGDVASSTAVGALRRLDGPTPGDLLEALAGAVHRAHDRIAELVEQQPELEGTSTTVTAVLFDGSRIGVAHVGDSRGYLLRDGTLSQLTRDHTFVQGLVDEGRITEEESRSHPQRNLILRAVDGVNETDPDLFYIELAPGDRLLLCSDGASGVLDEHRLADILGTGTVDYAAVELVRASLEAGSSDNVTCVVADVVDLGAPGVEETLTSGPLIVGAAAEQPRHAGSQGTFRGHRGGDTGEIEPVPGEVGDSGGDADPEELRYAPQAPRRGRWLGRAVVLLVLLLVLGVAGLVGYRWSQDQYFVAAHAGKVAIFRGVQADIPGLALSTVEEESDVTIAALPDYPTEQVASGIAASSLGDARSIVERLTGLARVCPGSRPGSGPGDSPSPSPSSSPSSSASAGSSAGPEPGGSPRSRPTSSPGAAGSRAPSAAPSPTASPTTSPTSPTSPTTDPTASPSGSPALAPPDCIEATT